MFTLAKLNSKKKKAQKRTHNMTKEEKREIVFMLVFELGFSDREMSEIIESAKEIREEKIGDYVSQTAQGVYDNLLDIDETIAKFSEKRSLKRLPTVSLAVLRLGVYEILFCENVPDSVAVSEAVRIAKRFGDEKDYAYINGVLGSVVKSKA